MASIHLLAVYLGLEAACQLGLGQTQDLVWLVSVVSLAALALMSIAGLIGIKITANVSRERDRPINHPESARLRFLARAGLSLTLFSIAITISVAIAALWLLPCSPGY
jgi:amino acid transporter